MKISRNRKHTARSRSRSCKYRHKMNRRRTRRGRRQPNRQQQQQQHRFRQSGGGLLNYLPSDLSTVARSAAHSIGGVWSGVKGVMGSDSPLPYDDHHLQKTSVSVSDHIPNLEQYYKNANDLIPNL